MKITNKQLQEAADKMLRESTQKENVNLGPLMFSAITEMMVLFAKSEIAARYHDKEWIGVTPETMPSNARLVLCAGTFSNYPTSGYYSNKNKMWVVANKGLNNNSVTHWMELPTINTDK